MNFKKRIFDYSQDVLKEALKSFADSHKTANVFKSEVLKGNAADGQRNVIEVVKCIEDFATIIANNGFNAETQTYMSLDEISGAMEDFIRQDGTEGMLTKDFSLNSLGFVISQTITRLVSQLDTYDLEAWMLVSRELVLKEGTVIYNVVVSNSGHATTRIAEGGEYNSFKLDSTEDYIKTSGGKVGVKASYSEEAALRAGAAAIKLLTEAAVADIKRYKSVEALHLLEANAKTRLDGLDPEMMPQGRSFENPKVRNSTLIMRDLEKFFADTQNEGFEVDVIFMNPLALGIFMHEPAVRAHLEKTANIQFIVPKRRESIAHNFLTKMTKTTSNTQKAAEGQSFTPPTGLIANKSLNIIVTPIVKFHKEGQAIFTPSTRYGKTPVVQHEAAPFTCADILLVDSSRALTYVHDGRGIMSDTIVNKLRDVTDIKFKTYYSFLLDKDHGVFAFRNIHITDDVFDPKQKVNVTLPHSEIFPGN